MDFKGRRNLLSGHPNSIPAPHMIKNLWDPKNREWKSLFVFRMHFHASNRISGEIIISGIPWNPTVYPKQAQVGNWIHKKSSSSNTSFDLVYHVTQTTQSTVQAIEFQRISHNGIIKVTSSQEITLSTKGFHPIRVLMQEWHIALLKVARELSTPTKLTPLFWIFESGFIKGLPQDPDEWHW